MIRTFSNVRLMSVLPRKQTLARVRVMSALPLKADTDQHGCDVRFVPIADSYTAAIHVAAIAGIGEFSAEVGAG